jgi:hypothetical protein
MIEGVSCDPLFVDQGKKFLASGVFEQKVVVGVTRYAQLLDSLALARPFFVMVSLLDVRGYVIAPPGHQYFTQHFPFDRDSLVLPEIVIQDGDSNIGRLLRPAFDAVWNAGGWPRSVNYDDDGNWKLKK